MEKHTCIWFDQHAINFRSDNGAHGSNPRTGDSMADLLEIVRYQKPVTIDPIECFKAESILERLYLEYFNNFLTIEAFADWLEVDTIQAKAVIMAGRHVNRKKGGK